MKTIESLIAEANAKGLWLANLFQLTEGRGFTEEPAAPTGVWQANFQHATGWHEFGRGDSIIAALENALDRCKGVHITNKIQPKTPIDPFS